MTTIKAAFALFLIGYAAPASATLVCPGGQTFPHYGPGDYEYCPTQPSEPTSITNSNTANSGAWAGAAAGAGASSNATGGNASAKGGNATARGGNQAQRQSQQNRQQQAQRNSQRSSQRARTGNVNNVNNYDAPASTAIAPSIAGCGGTAGGGFSAAIQTYGFGVSAARCKGDRFQQVIEAEERAAAGSPAAMAYLAHVDGSSRKAFRGDVVDIREDVIATAASAACQVVSRHSNGTPREVRAYPRPGRTSGEALQSCLNVRGLFLVQ